MGYIILLFVLLFSLLSAIIIPMPFLVRMILLILAAISALIVYFGIRREGGKRCK